MGRWPTDRASMIVAGPPWAMTTSAAAISATSSS